MEFLLNIWVWVGSFIFFTVLCIMLSILYYFLFNKTHIKTELKASLSKTPIAMFFQDNMYVDWKPITPINGIVYDKYYGPFMVTTTYVDKTTKNIIMVFDVDMDGDRTSSVKDLVNEFRLISTNEKSINGLRASISDKTVNVTTNIKNMTSHIKFSSLKSLFMSSTPHNIKSKIEKVVAMKVAKFKNVNPMHAVIVFGAIFGIIIIGAILLKIVGGV